jgi:hypothetical protein
VGVAAALATAALVVAVLLPEAASAHGFVGRQDLPIPRWLFGWGATAVLVASFVGLAALWPQPRLEGERRERVLLPRIPVVLEVLAGALGVALLGIVAWAGLAGTQSTTANLAPTVVAVLFWTGIPILSVLFGDVFAAINPWRAIGRGAGWLAGRVAPDSLPEPLPYPARVGRWPAALLLLGFTWFELVYRGFEDPSAVAIAALAYTAVQLVGMSLYGVQAWTRNGDAFGVFFGMFAALSPLHWHDRRLTLRPPLAGITRLDPVPGTVALLVIAIGTTSFDGASQGTLWSDVAPWLQERFTGLGLSASAALDLTFTTGLVAAVLIIGALYRMGIAGMQGIDRSPRAGELAGRFVHSLVPIALAYLIAHYFSQLAYQGQATAYLASDPLGRGWDLFGGAERSIDYAVLSANAIWYVQVGSLVLGHVAGLILAHDRALAVYRDPRLATRSQYWMLAVMIAFTSLGLWLLSATG